MQDWVIEKQRQTLAAQELSGVVDVMKSVRDPNRQAERQEKGASQNRIEQVEARSRSVDEELELKFNELTAKLASMQRRTQQPRRKAPRQSVSFDDTIEYFDRADSQKIKSRAVSSSEVLFMTPPLDSDSDEGDSHNAVFDEHHNTRRRLFRSDDEIDNSTT